MNPAVIFLLLFVGVPLFELYLMIEVGTSIGALPTVSLVVFTAVLGGLLVRMQGLATLRQVQATIARGEVPAIEMLGAVVLLLAGLLLLLPGFVTDLLGFLCLVPPLRHFLVLWVLKRSRVLQSPPRPPAASGSSRQRVIEGDFRRDDK